MNGPIILPPDLIEKAAREATERGMSLPDLVRASLERIVSSSPADDPMFADAAVFNGECPPDVAVRHDDYLYGDVP